MREVYNFQKSKENLSQQLDSSDRRNYLKGEKNNHQITWHSMKTQDQIYPFPNKCKCFKSF